MCTVEEFSIICNKTVLDNDTYFKFIVTTVGERITNVENIVSHYVQYIQTIKETLEQTNTRHNHDVCFSVGDNREKLSGEDGDYVPRVLRLGVHVAGGNGLLHSRLRLAAARCIDNTGRVPVLLLVNYCVHYFSFIRKFLITYLPAN